MCEETRLGIYTHDSSSLRLYILHTNMLTMTMLILSRCTIYWAMDVCTKFHCYHPTVVETFHYKQRLKTTNTTNVNLMEAQKEKSEDHQRGIHPLGKMNVCSKCHGIISNSC